MPTVFSPTPRKPPTSIKATRVSPSSCRIEVGDLADALLTRVDTLADQLARPELVRAKRDEVDLAGSGRGRGRFSLRGCGNLFFRRRRSQVFSRSLRGIGRSGRRHILTWLSRDCLFGCGSRRLLGRAAGSSVAGAAAVCSSAGAAGSSAAGAAAVSCRPWPLALQWLEPWQSCRLQLSAAGGRRLFRRLRPQPAAVSCSAGSQRRSSAGWSAAAAGRRVSSAGAAGSSALGPLPYPGEARPERLDGRGSIGRRGLLGCRARRRIEGRAIKRRSRFELLAGRGIDRRMSPSFSTTSSSSKGTATSFSPMPRKPPTPTTACVIAPSSLRIRSLTSPMLSDFRILARKDGAADEGGRERRLLWRESLFRGRELGRRFRLSRGGRRLSLLLDDRRVGLAVLSLRNRKCACAHQREHRRARHQFADHSILLVPRWMRNRSRCAVAHAAGCCLLAALVHCLTMLGNKRCSADARILLRAPTEQPIEPRKQEHSRRNS